MSAALLCSSAINHKYTITHIYYIFTFHTFLALWSGILCFAFWRYMISELWAKMAACGSLRRTHSNCYSSMPKFRIPRINDQNGHRRLAVSKSEIWQTQYEHAKRTKGLLFNWLTWSLCRQRTVKWKLFQPIHGRRGFCWCHLGKWQIAWIRSKKSGKTSSRPDGIQLHPRKEVRFMFTENAIKQAKRRRNSCSNSMTFGC